MTDFETEDGVVSIGDGVKLTGEIHAQDAVVVDGSFTGEITCRRLVVGASGVVDGRVSVLEADIHGRVIGDLVARQALVARATARIEGTWLVGEIVAERGAILNGKSGDAALRPELRTTVAEAPAAAPVATLKPSLRGSLAAGETRPATMGR